MEKGKLGKGVEAVPAYEEITERLQTIVYNLTDKGIDISADDKAFIESIPELASEEIPVVDENSMFPEYFEEFKVPKLAHAAEIKKGLEKAPF